LTTISSVTACLCPLRLSLGLHIPTPLGPQLCILQRSKNGLSVRLGAAEHRFGWDGEKTTSILTDDEPSAAHAPRLLPPWRSTWPLMADWEQALSARVLDIPELTSEFTQLCEHPEIYAATAPTLLRHLVHGRRPRPGPSWSNRTFVDGWIVAKTSPTRWRVLPPGTTKPGACPLAGIITERGGCSQIALAPFHDERWRGLIVGSRTHAVGLNPWPQFEGSLIQEAIPSLGLAATWATSHSEAARRAVDAIRSLLERIFSACAATASGADPGLVRMAIIGLVLISLKGRTSRAILTSTIAGDGLATWTIFAPLLDADERRAITQQVNDISQDRFELQPARIPADAGLPLPALAAQDEEIELDALSASEHLDALAAAEQLGLAP